MADNADRAAELMEKRLEDSLANRPRWIGFDPGAADCEDCGAEIPTPRRQAAPWATTCIECQSIRERRAELRR